MSALQTHHIRRARIFSANTFTWRLCYVTDAGTVPRVTTALGRRESLRRIDGHLTGSTEGLVTGHSPCKSGRRCQQICSRCCDTNARSWRTWPRQRRFCEVKLPMRKMRGGSAVQESQDSKVRMRTFECEWPDCEWRLVSEQWLYSEHMRPSFKLTIHTPLCHLATDGFIRTRDAILREVRTRDCLCQ